MSLFQMKGVKQKTLENGKVIQIQLLPAMKGLTMAKKLSQLFLPTLAGIVESGDDTGMGLTETASILVMSLEGLDEQEIITALLTNLVVDGQEVDFNEYFMGNYGELVEILTFALKENFESFFAGNAFVKQFKNKLSTMQQTIAE